MRQLYRMLGRNLDEPEALSAYFLTFVGTPGELPLMEEELPTVASGSFIALVDEFGQATQLVIDSAILGSFQSVTATQRLRRLQQRHCSGLLSEKR